MRPADRARAAVATVAPTRAALFGAMAGIGMAWGMTQFFMKTAMTGGFHPIAAAFWQAAAGALAVSALLLATGRRLPLSRRHVGFYAACGLLGTALPASLSFEAIRHLPVGVQSLVISTVPMMTVMLSVPLGLERAEGKRLAGVGLGFAAILLLVGPEASLPDPDQAAWVALPVVVALSYALENVVIARFRPADTDALATGAGLLIAATAMLAPAVLASGARAWPATLDAATLSLLAVVALNLGAYLGFVWLIGAGGPVFASQVGYVVTATGIVAGMVFLGERHAATVWAALALLFAGLALVSPRPAPRRSPDS